MKQNKTIIVLLAIALVAGGSLYVYTMQPEKVEYVKQEVLPTKDAVDNYIEGKLNDYKEQLKKEERIIREALAKENAYMEYTEEYVAMLEDRKAKAEELDSYFSLIRNMGLADDYTKLGNEMGISVMVLDDEK